VYVWADAVYLQARMEETAECMLVLIGATPAGKKELEPLASLWRMSPCGRLGPVFQAPLSRLDGILGRA
jgi:hypothetical protein